MSLTRLQAKLEAFEALPVDRSAKVISSIRTIISELIQCQQTNIEQLTLLVSRMHTETQQREEHRWQQLEHILQTCRLYDTATTNNTPPTSSNHPSSSSSSSRVDSTTQT
jgi:hypothetical protein